MTTDHNDNLPTMPTTDVLLACSMEHKDRLQLVKQRRETMLAEVANEGDEARKAQFVAHAHLIADMQKTLEQWITKNADLPADRAIACIYEMVADTISRVLHCANNEDVAMRTQMFTMCLKSVSSGLVARGTVLSPEKYEASLRGQRATTQRPVYDAQGNIIQRH